MGCSSSCQIFERFSTGLHNVGQFLMPNGMMFHILDDFLILAPTFDMCKRYLQEFLAICDKIGIPMAPEKTMGPSTCLTFLGIELNTVQKVARLPNDKVDRCLSLVSEFLQRKKGHFKRVVNIVWYSSFCLSGSCTRESVFAANV